MLKEWTSGKWGHMGRERAGTGVRHQDTVGYSRDCVAWLGHKVAAVFKGYINW